MSARTDAVLDRFPGHLSTGDPGKRFGLVVDGLGAGLDVLTRQSGQVRRSHRVGDASTMRDVLGLLAVHGFSASALALLEARWAAWADDVDAGAVRTAGDDPLALHRTVLLDVVGVATRGNGTPTALLEAAAAYLGLGVVGRWSSDDRWWHLVHCRDLLADALQEPDVPADPTPALDVIALEENPFRPADIDPVNRMHAARFRVLRGGMDEVSATVVVTGVQARTQRPMVVSLDDGHGLVFEGAVADGSELRFGASGRVTLDDADVTGSSWEFRGAVFASESEELAGTDFCYADAGAAADEAEDRPRDARFVVTAPAGNLMTTSGSLPHGAAGVGPVRLPVGHSRWACFVRLAHAGGVVGEPSVPRPSAGVFDQAVLGDAGSAGSLGAGPASLAVGFEWEEREPFAVRVLLPRRLSALDDEQGSVLREPLRRLLDRHRPAGVRVGVQYADPRWTLGEGIVRDDVSHALGAVVSGTELWAQDSAPAEPA